MKNSDSATATRSKTFAGRIARPYRMLRDRLLASRFGPLQGLRQVIAMQMKTTSIPNGSTLDFVAATWTKYASQVPAVRLNGRVFGQIAAF